MGDSIASGSYRVNAGAFSGGPDRLSKATEMLEEEMNQAKGKRRSGKQIVSCYGC